MCEKKKVKMYATCTASTRIKYKRVFGHKFPFIDSEVEMITLRKGNGHL